MLSLAAIVISCRDLLHYFGLWNIMFCEFKCLLSGCHFSHWRCFDFLRQWICLSLHPDLLRILPSCLFLLLCPLPFLSSNVRSKSSKSRILCLILNLLIFVEFVWSELTSVRTIGSSTTATTTILRALSLYVQCGRVLQSYGIRGLVHIKSILLLWIAVIITYALDLCSQIRQVFIQESIILVRLRFWHCATRCALSWSQLAYPHLRLQVHLHRLKLLHLLG